VVGLPSNVRRQQSVVLCLSTYLPTNLFFKLTTSDSQGVHTFRYLQYLRDNFTFRLGSKIQGNENTKKDFEAC
jgi:hypothetical protein